jgi:hypothetical protein
MSGRLVKAVATGAHVWYGRQLVRGDAFEGTEEEIEELRVLGFAERAKGEVSTRAMSAEAPAPADPEAAAPAPTPQASGGRRRNHSYEDRAMESKR